MVDDYEVFRLDFFFDYLPDKHNDKKFRGPIPFARLELLFSGESIEDRARFSPTLRQVTEVMDLGRYYNEMGFGPEFLGEPL